MKKKNYPNLNDRAYKIVKKMIKVSEHIGVTVSRAQNGAALIDAGIKTPGSPEAGRLFAEVCLGGTAEVSLGLSELGGASLPSVTVVVSDPVRGCMASQYAGWTIKTEGERPYFAMGSGPARALYGAEEIFKTIGNTERTEKPQAAVLALETRTYPPEDVLQYIAGRCGVEPEKLFVLLAPTASIAGCVQVAARIVETGLHKLHELGFDIKSVTAGWGTAPIAPVAANDGVAIGWTNDGILYGGRTWYTANCEDEEITKILDKLPAGASSDYGTPFFDLLKRYEWDFYKIDPMLFSPAEICINNARSGRTYRAGAITPSILKGWIGVDGF
ncbi:MAG: methenyltetrahydromethanopterin cyclohydrolase [Synergistaceae bacterium]|nr:methenyltetrahydromethanopterin cyclohydrolase [Synergistaceae bacterium]